MIFGDGDLEVIRVRRCHEGRALIVFLMQRETREGLCPYGCMPFFSLLSEDTAGCLQTKERAFIRIWPCLHTDLRFLALRIGRHTFQGFKLPSPQYCVMASELTNVVTLTPWPPYEHKNSKKYSFYMNFYYHKYTWHHMFRSVSWRLERGLVVCLFH